MKRNGSRKAGRPEVENTKAAPADAYTPPGREKRGDANTARYLITDYDKPIEPTSQEHTDFLLALHRAAKLLRKEAMKWLDKIDWSGNTGEQSEQDIEARFGRADNCDNEARLLLGEYRRGCRREWIAHFPRKGPQYRPEVYATWKRYAREDKARERKMLRKAARS